MDGNGGNRMMQVSCGNPDIPQLIEWTMEMDSVGR